MHHTVGILSEKCEVHRYHQVQASQSILTQNKTATMPWGCSTVRPGPNMWSAVDKVLMWHTVVPKYSRQVLDQHHCGFTMPVFSQCCVCSYVPGYLVSTNIQLPED